jgi:hypothetical protein
MITTNQCQKQTHDQLIKSLDLQTYNHTVLRIGLSIGYFCNSPSANFLKHENFVNDLMLGFTAFNLYILPESKKHGFDYSVHFIEVICHYESGGIPKARHHMFEVTTHHFSHNDLKYIESN